MDISHIRTIGQIEDFLNASYAVNSGGNSKEETYKWLEELIIICPFKIINFHSDNGSEYINKVVADILNRLHIGQIKSRPRKHNDNALVETKNGSIIHKELPQNSLS